MRKLTMFITAVCVLFLIKLQWPKGPVIIYRPGGGGGGGGGKRRIWGFGAKQGEIDFSRSPL